MTFFSTADYQEHYLQQLSSQDSFLGVGLFVRIHPRLFAEDVSVVVVAVVEVMMVLALVVHCLMLLVYLLKIICP
jgi:hypothetical protein